MFKAKVPDGTARPIRVNTSIKEMCGAAAHSLHIRARPGYGQIVVMVARKLDVPVPIDAPVEEVERVILFKVLQQSMEKMNPEERAKLQENVQKQLTDRGIHDKVTFDELLRFAKFAGVDLGGTVGGLVFAAPGMVGVLGFNFLQFLILKAIILTSGYYAGLTAILGMGTGGALLAVAGAAGPIGAGFALLYTIYTVGGPAYRKLIPAVCSIAAKRLELLAEQTADGDAQSFRYGN